MKVVYTAAAQTDLRDIGEWLAAHYPVFAPRVERRIRDVVAHIARWPESAPRSAGRAGVRVVPLGESLCLSSRPAFKAAVKLPYTALNVPAISTT